MKGLVTKTANIYNTLKSAFANLYYSEDQFSQELFDLLFDNLNLPLLPGDLEKLDAPITLDELRTAVKLANRGCSPGIGGNQAEFYLELENTVEPIWPHSINLAIGKGFFHTDLNTAPISVLHKPGKNPQNC